MKHIRKFNQVNEKLITTLDIEGGESLLDIKIENDVPKHLVKYIPTIGDIINSKQGYGLFISCNDGDTIYHFTSDSSKIYKKSEFNNMFYDYDENMDTHNELLGDSSDEKNHYNFYDEKIISIVKDYFDCDNIKVYLEYP
jgi:hypothetical protein